MKPSGKLQQFLRPQMFIPSILSLALLALAFTLSNLGEVWDYLQGLSWPAAAACFWFTFCYLLYKGLEFKLLLGQVGIDLSWREMLLALAVGEMMVGVPAGIYAENYVLKRSRGDSFAVSAAATTSAMMIQTFLSLGLLLVFGSAGWRWLRPTALLLMAGMLIFIALFVRSAAIHRLSEQGYGNGNWWGKAIRGFGRLDRRMWRIFSSPTLAAAVVLDAAHIGFKLAAFYVLAVSVGMSPSIQQAVSIYLTADLFSDFVGGVLPQLGVTELVGQGAAGAWGYSLSQGLAFMIAFRVVWMASIWLLCSPVVLLYWNQLRGPQQGAASAGDLSS